MAITKTIIVDVQGDDIQKLENDLKGLDNQFENVESSAKKAGKGVEEVTGNGGAIAILDELTGGLATRFKDAFEASKLFSISLKGIRGALIATGIGAFVVALGAVVAYWSDIKELVTGVNAELEEQLTIQNEIVRQTERELKNLENSENVLRLQGKSESEILRLKKERVLAVLKEQKEALKLAKLQLDNQINAENRALETFDKISGLSSFIFIEIAKQIDNILAKFGIDSGLAEKAVSIRGSIFDTLFGNKEGIEERKREIEDLTDSIIANENRVAGLTLQQGELPQRGQQQGVEGLSQKDLQLIETEKLVNEEINKIRAEALEKGILMEEIAAARRIQLERLVAQAKIKSVQGSISAIAGFLDESTGAYKALAVTNAIIDAYQAISGTFANASKNPASILFPAYPFIQAGIAGLNAFNTVQKILSVKPGQTSASPPTQGQPGGIAQETPPEFNVIGEGGINQLAQSLNNEERPIQAFVVATEVTNAESLERNRVRQSSFG